MEKINLRQAIVVEGKYDAIRLNALFNTLILPVNGFQIYKNAGTRALLLRIAGQRGLVIATDSDAAGFQLRGYLRQFVPAEQLWHVVIPAVPGKERRKAAPSKAGTMGVEGMDTQTLLAAFHHVIRAQQPGGTPDYVTKMELWRDGFSGTPGCGGRYGALLGALDLPPGTSANLFCACVTKEEYQAAKERL
ncbi:MAG: DUF4093 domain-containing protein [Oscillospiraceae bacterium]|jgi:ribonuclease M5|nr:DUF4093 domain-containing protein [Oscillospiraceae bacterium]